ncbi:uracil-DNA glycosylase [Candidatus Peribacteria bacterium]|nr:uracil-DNA glycosylase [Candidatus Peribacteria bacterium]
MPILTLDLLKEKLTVWKGCDLSKTANAVLGEGNPHATVMIIGEAPGEKENELRRPFVGAAGKYLDELLESIQLKREDVYISNVVKYCPPDTRDPKPIEKEQCMPWLMLEIALVKPKVIVTLGRHSLGHFFSGITISEAHGNAFPITASITLFSVYHPAAALHNGSLRSALQSDFYKLGDFLKTVQ